MTLPFVTKDQAEKLKKLGFDLEIDYAYHIESGITVPIVGTAVNWNAYPKSVSAPTVALAMKWLRDTFGVSHTIYARSLTKGVFGYSVSHAILGLECTMADLTKGHELEEAGTDGINAMNYDDAESKGLDFSLDWLLEKCEMATGMNPKEKIANYCADMMNR